MPRRGSPRRPRFRRSRRPARGRRCSRSAGAAASAPPSGSSAGSRALESPRARCRSRGSAWSRRRRAAPNAAAASRAARRARRRCRRSARGGRGLRGRAARRRRAGRSARARRRSCRRSARAGRHRRCERMPPPAHGAPGRTCARWPPRHHDDAVRRQRGACPKDAAARRSAEVRFVGRIHVRRSRKRVLGRHRCNLPTDCTGRMPGAHRRTWGQARLATPELPAQTGLSPSGSVGRRSPRHTRAAGVGSPSSTFFTASAAASAFTPASGTVPSCAAIRPATYGAANEVPLHTAKPPR